MTELTAERLRFLLSYDSQTGVFLWHNPVAHGVRRGDVAGYLKPNGYIAIRVDKVKYSAHRLAWLYEYGVWPSDVIDHINRRKADNRISNLRDVNKSVNGLNRVRKGGVRKVGRVWQARLSRQGLPRFCATFPTREEAHAALLIESARAA